MTTDKALSGPERAAHFNACLVERRRLGLSLDRATVEALAVEHGVTADAAHAVALEADKEHRREIGLAWRRGLGLAPSASEEELAERVLEAVQASREIPAKYRYMMASAFGITRAEADRCLGMLAEGIAPFEALANEREQAKAAEGRALAIRRAEDEIERLKAL